MNRSARNAYAREVQWQAQIAAWSFEALESALGARTRALESLVKLLKPGTDEIPKEKRAEASGFYAEAEKQLVRALMELQSMYVAVGVLSAIFWPNVKFGSPAEIGLRKRRAEFLRRWMKMPDEPYFKIVPWGATDLRGGLSHADEVLDVSVAHAGVGRVDLFAIGEFAPETDPYPLHAVRRLDPESMLLTVGGGRSADLRRLYAEVKAIAETFVPVRRITLARLPTNGPGGRFVTTTGSSPIDLRPFASE